MIRRKPKPVSALQIGTPQWPTSTSAMHELLAALEYLYKEPPHDR